MLDQSPIEEGEVGESRPEEVETEVFDRELYYQMHDTLTSELPAIKIRNNFLQKKMVEYFRKRNVNVLFVCYCQYVYFYLDGACLQRG